MTARKTFIWTAVVSSVLLVSGCAVQQKFDDTNASLRNAQLQGEIKDALAYYESEAQRAEKNNDWGTGVNAYLQAAKAARFTGQLQKAITFGAKALEIAHATQVSVLPLSGGRTLHPPPIPEINAIVSLIRSYTSIRDFDKVKALAERGLMLLRENLVDNPFWRLARESDLYTELGKDLMRRGDYEKAIEALSQAVYLQRSHFAGRSRGRRAKKGPAENSETELIERFLDLGHAYRLAGRFDDAVNVYQEASLHTSVGGTRAIYEQAIYEGLGQVYLQQKQLPLALENFQKALSLAEKQQDSQAINSASLGIAATWRQTGDPVQAMP